MSSHYTLDRGSFLFSFSLRTGRRRRYEEREGRKQGEGEIMDIPRTSTYLRHANHSTLSTRKRRETG